MELIYVYILIGFIGGITAGMLGLGGGIIFVPSLMIIHKYFDMFSDHELQVAVYTSLICIIFAGSTSSYLHYKNKLINLKVVRKYFLFVSVGCFFGIYILEHASSGFLEIIYSLILIILAMLLISDARIIKDNIKILDKISSKNELIKLTNNKEYIYKDLSIKSIKCTDAEFDDNPEIKAYIQVRDLTKKDRNNVFVFNGWMFSSSPSIAPFDHPVYDIWLINCY